MKRLKKPPKYAISNGSAIGHIPESIYPSLFFRTIHYFYLGRIHDFREKIPIIRAKLPNSLNPKIK